MLQNTQKVEKVESEPAQADSLDVVGIWQTIQGEGPFVGAPCVFIRLAGCNLQCPQCDTDYTSQRAQMSIDAIIAEVQRLSPGEKGTPQLPLVVITGGEPFRQACLADLVWGLHYKGFHSQIESNGTIFQRGLPLYIRRNHIPAVTIVVSPKANVCAEIIPHIDALKYVVRHCNVNWDDGLPYNVLGSRIPVWRPSDSIAQFPELAQVPIYIQPEDDGQATHGLVAMNVETAVSSCMRFGYRLCLQTHKIVGLK